MARAVRNFGQPVFAGRWARRLARVQWSVSMMGLLGDCGLLAKKLHDAEYHPCTGDYASCTALGGRYPSWEQEAKAILQAPDPSWVENPDGYFIAIWRESMTLVEAAVALGVTAATLRQQIVNGKLKARKVGRDWSVTSREVERYRKENRRATAP